MELFELGYLGEGAPLDKDIDGWAKKNGFVEVDPTPEEKSSALESAREKGLEVERLRAFAKPGVRVVLVEVANLLSKE